MPRECHEYTTNPAQIPAIAIGICRYCDAFTKARRVRYCKNYEALVDASDVFWLGMKIASHKPLNILKNSGFGSF